MSLENEEEHRNFIEAKIIIQEFHDDDQVFIVGTAPFGKLWFDHDKIEQQYKVLTDSWYEEYGENETQHSKRPRIVSVLLDENDSMFNKYRDNIREAQEKKQQENAAKNNVAIENNLSKENVIVEHVETENVDEPLSPKKSEKKQEKKAKKKDIDDNCKVESPSKGKRGRPKKKETNIMEAFSKSKETK